jgi:hypothetical protein
MKEIFIDKNDPYFNRPKAFYILVFSVFIFGCLIAYLFIPPEQKIVQVPVEKIKYVDRVVEKKVEVPVEKIQYVDRVVEKTVEVPVEKIVYREPKTNPQPLYKKNWRYIQKGMTKSEVSNILGLPDRVISYLDATEWFYGKYPNDTMITFAMTVKYDSAYNKTESKEEVVTDWRGPY